MVEEVDSNKYLGVKFISDITWSSQTGKADEFLHHDFKQYTKKAKAATHVRYTLHIFSMGPSLPLWQNNLE